MSPRCPGVTDRFPVSAGSEIRGHAVVVNGQVAIIGLVAKHLSWESEVAAKKVLGVKSGQKRRSGRRSPDGAG